MVYTNGKISYIFSTHKNFRKSDTPLVFSKTLLRIDQSPRFLFTAFCRLTMLYIVLICHYQISPGLKKLRELRFKSSKLKITWIHRRTENWCILQKV